MKKNIMNFALAISQNPSVIDLTIADGRVEFKAHKSVVTQCFNIAFISDAKINSVPFKE